MLLDVTHPTAREHQQGPDGACGVPRALAARAPTARPYAEELAPFAALGEELEELSAALVLLGLTRALATK